MTESATLCESCGAPAVVHVTKNVDGRPTIRHFCSRCSRVESDRAHAEAAAVANRHHKRHQKRDLALILVALGAQVAGLSLFADFLAVGGSAGFGAKQFIVLAIGGVLATVGAAMRGRLLFVIGVMFVGLTLLADWLAFGNRPGFGWMQLAGAIIGGAYVLAGLYLARDVERS